MAKIITDQGKIENLLARGVEEVIVKDHLQAALLSGRKLRIKLGNDPTSPNIHLGRASVLKKLRAFQELGHAVIFIVGDFTGLIGDTSDKEADRPMLTEAEIKRNMKTYFSQAFKILDKHQTETHYNSKWLKKLGFKEIGALADLFGLHEFEARENIARRLKSGRRVSLREVLYPLMQGYDSVAVKADVEIGGTDQKFNLLAGRAIQERYNQIPQDIMTTSILEGLDGRKMSSSWGNVINITDEPNDIFGKAMSLKDDLIEKYFLLATDLSEESIPGILARGPRDAKLALAKEIVRLYHGEKAARSAEDYFVRVFSKKEKPGDIKIIKLGIQKINLTELLLKINFAASKGEARRLIRQGGVRINDLRKTDPGEMVDILKPIIIQAGPRKFARVEF